MSFNHFRTPRHDLAAPDATHQTDEKADPNVYDSSASDSDTLSLEARAEKEANEHPDRVTSWEDVGVQKAEAAALVWSKKAVLSTYAWYASASQVFEHAY